MIHPGALIVVVNSFRNVDHGSSRSTRPRCLLLLIMPCACVSAAQGKAACGLGQALGGNGAGRGCREASLQPRGGCLDLGCHLGGMVPVEGHKGLDRPVRSAFIFGNFKFFVRFKCFRAFIIIILIIFVFFFFNARCFL